jgi:hypothetical protein
MLTDKRVFSKIRQEKDSAMRQCVSQIRNSLESCESARPQSSGSHPQPKQYSEEKANSAFLPLLPQKT